MSSRPERTRISYFALLAATTCAALLKESRMQTLKATAFTGDPGERSGEICGPFLEMFFDRAKKMARTKPEWVASILKGTL